MSDVRILLHDGLGSDATISNPLDTLFTIEPEPQITETVTAATAPPEKKVYILSPLAHTDLNGDGKQNLADVSVFMIHLTTNNLRSDFNQDKVVDLKDLSILLDSK